MSSPKTMHFAAFKWKEGAPIEDIERLLDSQKQLAPTTIPGLRSFDWGHNRSPAAKGHTHALVIVADDQSVIDAYRKSDLRNGMNTVFRAWMESDLSADFDRA
jgi:hypothetical protein